MGNPIALIRAANTVLGHVAPGLSAAVAERLFTTPRRYTPPPREAAAEQLGRRVSLGEGRSGLWFSRGAGPKLLAIHGWEGRATQWGPLAEAATRAGFELLAVDAPAHGHSTGSTAHPAVFAQALLEADRRHGPFTAVLGHSMGGSSAALALAGGLRAKRVVLIASPSSTLGVLRRFSGYIGLSKPAQRRFFDRLEDRVGHAPDELDVAALAHRQPTLVIHSRDDREVPFADAEAIAEGWPQAELLALDGLGHRRILRDEQVVAAALGFVGGESLARAG